MPASALLLALSTLAPAAEVAMPGASSSPGPVLPGTTPSVPTAPSGEIWNGTAVASGELEAVVALYVEDPSATFCSGTLIDPEWVLTAGHCFGDPQIQSYLGQGARLYVGVGREMPYAAHLQVDVAGSAYHPDYDPLGEAGQGHDIALLHLAQPATAVDPIPFNTTTLGNAFVGLPVTVAGFGVTDDGADDSGTKHRAELSLFGFDGDLIDLFNGSLDGQGQPAAWDGTSNACQGDSGGATLAKDANGDWVLVGVTVIVFPQCAQGGAGSTRTDLYASWIEGYVASGGSTTDPDPPDAPDALFTLDPTKGGKLRDPELGAPAVPGDDAHYPTIETSSEGAGCATVDGAGLLALTGLLAARRRRR